jgi:hypothetical protein
MGSSLSEQIPLIDSKEKKKQDKQKKKASKTKSKEKLKNENYQVVDAIISSPISLRLPDSYLTKYNVNPPLDQSSPLQSIPPSITSNKPVITTTVTDLNLREKNQTLFHIEKLVRELELHHASALKASLNTVPSTTIQSKQSVNIINEPVSRVNEILHQQSLLKQAHPIVSNNQIETNLQSQPIKPRIIYRYMDE